MTRASIVFADLFWFKLRELGKRQKKRMEIETSLTNEDFRKLLENNHRHTSITEQDGSMFARPKPVNKPHYKKATLVLLFSCARFLSSLDFCSLLAVQTF